MSDEPTMSSEPLADLTDMFMAHVMFRREFGLVRGVEGGDTERVAIVADHLQLIDNVLHHHHRAEDTHVWPLLLQRAGAEIEPVVRLMEEQHGEVARLLAELRDRLAQWRGTAASAQGEALADTAARLTEVLTEHLAVEEERVVPLMEQHITAAEWGRAVADGSADIPQEMMSMLFGMMAYEADPDAFANLIASMPPELRSLTGDRSAQEYAEYAQRVHRTATPLRIGASR